MIEATVKSMVKNEATGQVLGVEYVRKGGDYREYVFQTFIAPAHT